MPVGGIRMNHIIAPPPPTVQTLVEVLRYRATENPDQTAIALLHRTRIEKQFTFQELYHLALDTSGVLFQHGVKKGDRVILILPTSSNFFASFWGTLLVGAVPVPIYPPIRLHRMHDYHSYLKTIVQKSEAHIILTDSDIYPLVRFIQREIRDVTLLKIDDVHGPPLSSPVSVEPEDIAMIQFTSGSTATPKGVQLHHQNMIENLLAIGLHLQVLDSDVAVSWLPLYHDMGLIGFVLGGVYWRIPIMIFSPLEFIRRPSFWLKAITRYHGTISAGPNFAYSVCATRVKEADLADINLSSWRIAMCGAEPIQAETMALFAKRFSHYGFRKEALTPAYGLAENTLAVTLGQVEEIARTDSIDRDIFEAERKAVPVPPDSPNPMQWVSCGVPIPRVNVKIVNEDFQELPERHEGLILINTPSMMSGYYKDERATEEVFHDGWLLTGDLGYIAEGELFVTGRKKEVIIRGGRNYYPQDIERVVNHIEGIRKGDVVAIGVPDINQGTEKIVIIAETRIKDPEQWKILEKTIREKVLKEAGVPVGEILLVKPGTIPKTSSGKLQRVQTRRLYLNGTIKPLTETESEPPGWVKTLQIFIRYKLFRGRF